MSTRYSLPPHAPRSDTDTARTVRSLAAAVLFVAVWAVTLMTVLWPPAEPEVAHAPPAEPTATAASVPGA